MIDRNAFDTKTPPFETAELRSSLGKFMRSDFVDPVTGLTNKIGSFTWGVYAFFDYDGEPIYVGQTKESVSGRVGRHLTGQRTDAVAKSVLDPLEVKDIQIWPLPQFKGVTAKKKPLEHKIATQHLNALEYLIHQKLIAESRFNAILNEKDPPVPKMVVTEPASFKGRIVSNAVIEIRGHPDFRISRRAMVIARLSQGIAERKIDGGEGGLRRVLLTQAKRLQWLADQRYFALGGDKTVPVGQEENNGIEE
ncbi:GIY-YIG nuclease family protein [Seohaeicola saemankumensis]|nr:GIY-YIG nuclease family protein [Seohaeicola saemankumensis]